MYHFKYFVRSHKGALKWFVDESNLRKRLSEMEHYCPQQESQDRSYSGKRAKEQRRDYLGDSHSKLHHRSDRTQPVVGCRVRIAYWKEARVENAYETYVICW